MNDRQPDDPQQGSDSRSEYGESYFDYYGGTPYLPNQHWRAFFNGIAQSIFEQISPGSVLDVGCAKGFLVDALRRGGVDAYGMDVSSYALNQAHEGVKPYLWQGSVLEPLPTGFDLTVCIEVLEHLGDSHAALAVSHLAQSSNDILFSSTPEDFAEKTHKNVRPLEYWARLFAEHGFYRDLDFDVGFVGWHAVRFRKQNLSADELLAGYERKLAKVLQSNHQLRQLAERQQEIATDQALSLPIDEDRPKGTSAGASSPGVHDNSSVQVQLAGDPPHLLRRAQTAEAERDRILREWTFLNHTASWQLIQRWWGWKLAWIPEGSLRHRTYTAVQRIVKRVLGISGRRFWSRTSSDGAPSQQSPTNKPWFGYAEWVQLNEPSRQTLAEQAEASKHFPVKPRFSVITPIFNTDPDHLSQALQSIAVQTYDRWELCLVDASDSGHRASSIAAKFVEQEPRARLTRLPTNGGIARNSNEALSMATGDFIVLLDHDDMLAPFALFELASRLNRDPELDLLYSDHDLIGEDGQRRSPLFKPGWSPETMLSANYITHLTAIRTELVRQVGGFRSEMDGAQDWDLFFRITEQTDRIAHVAKVLYHWRDSRQSTASDNARKPYAPRNQLKAIQSHLDRSLGEGDARFDESGFIRVSWPIKDQAMVSIVIPTLGSAPLIKTCVQSVLDRTSYPEFEIILVDTGSVDKETLEFYSEISRHELVKLVRTEAPFNYSAANNLGVRHADGQLFLFLNNDVQILHEGWLSELVRWAELEDVGAVGAKLLYPDGRIQHAGVIVGLTGFAGHVFNGATEGTNSPFGYPEWYRDLSAVTGACMMTRRAVFEEVGGFDEIFQLNGNDVEYCLRVRGTGRRIVYTPFSRLMHHESATHGGKVPDRDFITSFEHYEVLLRSGDPYYSPNLSLQSSIPMIKQPLEPAAVELAIDHISRLDESDASAEEANPDRAESRTTGNLTGRMISIGRKALSSLGGAVTDPSDIWASYRQTAQSSATWFDFSLEDIDISNQIQRDGQGLDKIQSINWFLPDIEYAYFGGVHTILRFAAHFHTQHDVLNRFVIMGSSDPDGVSSRISRAFPSLAGAPVAALQSVSEVALVPPADAAVASLWSTAYALLKFNRTQRKFYFIQDFEPAFYPAGSMYALAQATYRFGFFGIANTESLHDRFVQDYGGKAVHFMPAVDAEVFYPSPSQQRAEEARLKVFFYARPSHPRNAFELGAEALAVLKRRYGTRVEIVTAGADWDPKQYGLEHTLKNLGRLNYAETSNLYRSCHLGLVLTYSQHPSYLPLELMASGCVVISNLNPATTWLLKDGENCFLSNSSASAIADTLTEAIENTQRRHEIRDRALEYIQQNHMDWAAEIEKVFAFMCDPGNL